MSQVGQQNAEEEVRRADGSAVALWQYSPPATASEYHLIDLGTGTSHGGFETLTGARQCAREKGLSAWDIFHGNHRVEYHDPRRTWAEPAGTAYLDRWFRRERTQAAGRTHTGALGAAGGFVPETVRYPTDMRVSRFCDLQPSSGYHATP